MRHSDKNNQQDAHVCLSMRTCLGRPPGDESAARHQAAAAALAATRRAKSSPGRPNRHGPAGSQRAAPQAKDRHLWHHKQTGIRSRPIKLLTHPIEHIERKIILTYLLAFAFKFMAILTGPIVVLLLYLITLPFQMCRRLTWALLNLSFVCDARIKTSSSRRLPKRPAAFSHLSSWWLVDSGASKTTTSAATHESSETIATEAPLDTQTYWNYCPLSFMETYWFREKLVNNVILVIDDGKRKFSIEKLREHLARNALELPEYRKFLSRVVSRGIPLYKSHYWHHLGLLEHSERSQSGSVEGRTNNPANKTTGSSNDIPWEHQITTTINKSGPEQHRQAGASSAASSSASAAGAAANGSASDLSDKFSMSFQSSVISVSVPNPCQSVHLNLPVAEGDTEAGSAKKSEKGVDLRHHVYMDHILNDDDDAAAAAAAAACPEINLATIRRYACKLLNIHLDLRRPLWELRAIRARSANKVYLIFRCHQSLADGKSLSKMLTEQLAVPPPSSHCDTSPASIPRIRLQNAHSPTSSPAATASHKQQQAADGELRPLREKESFVSRIGEANSRLSAIFVGPLTVLLWIIWSFTRRKNNHLNKCLPVVESAPDAGSAAAAAAALGAADPRRFHMTQYDLTKFHQIKQMTRSTVSDVILCALSGALRDYLRKFNAVSNPPNLNISLTVDMRQPKQQQKAGRHRQQQQLPAPSSKCNHQQSFASASSSGSSSGASSATSSGGSAETEGSALAQGYRRQSCCCQHQGDQQQPQQPQRRQDDCRDVQLAPAEAEPEVNCTMVNVPIPTSVEGTVPRLWDIRGTMEELRTSADPWVMLGLQRLLFELLPAGWYRNVINYIALGNSSAFVSSIQGPQNMIESWCVDLFQRALVEARQAPKICMLGAGAPQEWSSSAANHEHRKRLRETGRLELVAGMGTISAIYYCMQPPTSNIPISFNCISYHSKLFVSVLSRSLLVEDSKLLLGLFFRQLDQLAGTIARRRSLATIIQNPAVPIEISSPAADHHRQRSEQGLGHEGPEYRPEDDDRELVEEERDLRSETLSVGARLRSQLLGGPKDDLETDVGSSGSKCQVCLRRVCACRRRKSLFALDGSRERSANLVSLLRPLQSRSRRSLSPQSAAGSPNEMRSLEELREEDTALEGGADPAATIRLAPSQVAGGEPAATWRRGPKRSTLSLDFSARDTRGAGRAVAAADGEHISTQTVDQVRSCRRLDHSGGSFGGSRECGLHHSDNQLLVPTGNERPKDSAGGVGAVSGKQVHSRSETDLLPSVCRLAPREDGRSDDEQVGGRRGSAASWLACVVRRSQPSRFSRRLSRSAAASNAHQLDNSTGGAISPRSSFAANLNSAGSLRTERRSILEAPLSLLLPRRFGGSDVTASADQTQAAKRRRSAAGGAGLGIAQPRSLAVMVKDETNADVSLRYRHQLEAPLRSFRSRRFSAMVGSPSGSSQRRASLVPFGLMQQQQQQQIRSNSSLTRMFYPEETHV